jgi:multimeric flavodoxin WrbA
MKGLNILGVAASQRSGGPGLNIKDLPNSRPEFDIFLADQAQRELPNSELCLLSALWGAKSQGAEIESTTLSNYFQAGGAGLHIEEIRPLLQRADGIILSSPVYFGDSSSLSRRFIEFLREDQELRKSMAGKIYGGLAVGAKRNGGQETTLIYNLSDMLNLGLLGVGNDSSTTVQYGGIAVAGDKGTVAADTFGLETCIGTGKRVARVAKLNACGQMHATDKMPLFDFWILQEKNQTAEGYLMPILEMIAKAGAAVNIRRIYNDIIEPCQACDKCPYHNGGCEKYCCFIDSPYDGMKKAHNELQQADIIVPTLFSPKERAGLKSIYKEFLERTRYLRRGDYAFHNRLVIPMVFNEMGVNEHLDIRMITSFIRHSTIIHKPVIGWHHRGELVNKDEIFEDFSMALILGKRLFDGRTSGVCDSESPKYRPIGYGAS